MVPPRGHPLRKTGHPLPWHGHPGNNIPPPMIEFTRHDLVHRLLGALLFTNLGAPKVRRTEQKCAERSPDQDRGMNQAMGKTVGISLLRISRFFWTSL